jgi:DNA-directed RNA polymerase subunit M/transcription elongation factor TFIIS
MKFCPVCRNVLYSIDEENGHAILNCRKCEFKEDISRDNSIVYEHILKNDSSVKLVMNPYLKYDATLPRFTEIDCPNKECPTKQGTKNDIVGVKIDKQHLIWMYQCANCDTTWKQNSQAT